ncbi:hypothetical protein ACJMK2_034081 [Sinanodonta woodiana]|uniref:Uncharacterized protein n=1 Tax=Sinanodonta woodiana TaxID=1069815 RepID=A0ABD3WRX1_SINWO
MVDIMTLNQLFFLGILIPTLVTVAIFVTFLVCWYRMRIRDRIRYKRHDPHGRFKDRENLPPDLQKNGPLQSLTLSNTEQNIQKHDNNNEKKTDGNYEESGEIVEERLQENTRQMFHPSHDIGMADSGDVHKHNQETQRPNSQASTDSEDSGFKSSRSGQYNHSASSSNAQDQCQSSLVNSKPHDSLPLFRPIKINASDARQMLRMPVHRTPNKHKRYMRKPLPSSQTIETIDLDHIHPDLHVHPKNSMQAMSKQLPIIPLHPEMTFTTVMVHRTFTDEICDSTFSAA